MKRLWLFVIFALLLFSAIAITGCGKEEEESEPESPTIPPSGIFSMDLSLYSSSSLYRSMADLEHCAHFDTAAVILIAWGTLTEALFLFPQLAFALAISQPHIYEGDNTWRWTFTITDSNTINLYAHLLLPDSVQWDMRLDNPVMDNFLWYTGRCDLSALGGWWQFNEKGTLGDEVPVLWVNWERSNDADTNATLEIINIKEEADGYGDTLRYSIDGTIANAHCYTSLEPRPGNWDITWDTESHWGHIIYPEETEGCWDDSLECIDCDSLPAM